jgi:hypothetical protein
MTYLPLKCLAIGGLFFLFCTRLFGQFACPAGESDMMKYFALAQENRSDHYLTGSKNSIYTEVFPNEDFADSGYWFWLKSAAAHGFDVKAFNRKYIYMRSTELVWTDNTTFKRFKYDLPIAARCVAEGEPGPEIKVPDTGYQYYSSCNPYKESNLGTAVNDLDAPVLMNVGGDIGQAWTRVFHYHYGCNKDFEQCTDEEQFFLANGYGEWQWKHFKNGQLVNTTLIPEMKQGSTSATLPCANSYEPRR